MPPYGQEIDEAPADRRKLQNRIAQRKFREKKAQQQQLAAAAVASGPGDRNEVDITPDILPWLSTMCSISNANFANISNQPQYGVHSLAGLPGDNRLSVQGLASATNAEVNLPRHGLKCAKCRETLALEHAGMGQAPLLLQCTPCPCTTTQHPGPSSTSTGAPSVRINRDHRASGTSHHNAWELEDMQLLENIHDQLRYDSSPAISEVNENLLASNSSLTDSIDGNSTLLPLYDISDFPHINVSGHLHSQTHSNSGDLTLAAGPSGADIWTNGSHGAAGTNEPRHPLLHVAAQNGHCNIVQMLIEHQVNINERDSSGMTALHLAVQHRHDGAVRLLLQNGADINACDYKGSSPLFLAVSIGFEDAVRLFLSHSANPRLNITEQPS